jgi:uncharacterized membrane protein YcaP (DUF421 family)
MITQLFKALQEAVGITTLSFTALFYMIIRGIIVYLFGVTLARFNKKLLGIRTPFNFILYIMLGSIFANAILNADVFLPTLGTIIILMLLNGLVTVLAFHFITIETLIKGSPSILIKDGEIQKSVMKKNFITDRELFNELNAQLQTRDLSQIETAILTSDGTINFIKKK